VARPRAAAAQVTDVSDARDVTGKSTSVKLTTAGGRVCYIADSETEQVEWFSALEGAVARIVKQARAPRPRRPPRRPVRLYPQCTYAAGYWCAREACEAVRPWRA